MPLDAAKISISTIDAELKKRAAENFRVFIGLANHRFQFYDHCERLADVLERVASGEIKRLMIFLPPRHTKSELVSRLFSAYYLLRNPHHFVGINSYASDLAFTLSRAARQNFIECGGQIREDAAAIKHWETVQGGGMWAAGVGGPITGKGCHLGIIDDPLKNAEEANSPVIREKQKEWYSSTFYTRLEPNAAVVLIQTRWNEDDLAGWLLTEEENETESPEGWHIVCLPAFADDLQPFPDTCTVEPDWRENGEALCPERYDELALRRIKAKGERNFQALYQQRPTAKEGYFFDITKLEIVDAAPAEGRRARGWDKAATPGDGDYTVGVRVSKNGTGIYYIEDATRGQWDTATRDNHIRQTTELDGTSVHQKGEQEPGSGGKESAENFIRLLSGFPVSTERSTANKEQRADPFSSQVNAGNVKLVRGPWNKAFLEELRQFPFGAHDDQVDAVSLAFNHLNGSQPWRVSEFRF